MKPWLLARMSGLLAGMLLGYALSHWANLPLTFALGLGLLAFCCAALSWQWFNAGGE